MGDQFSSGTHLQTTSLPAAVAAPPQLLRPSVIALNSQASSTSSVTLNARTPQPNRSANMYQATSTAEVLHTPVKVLHTPVAGPTRRQTTPGFDFADTLFLDDNKALPLSPPETRSVTEVGVQTDNVRPSEVNPTMLINSIATILEAGFAKVAETTDRNSRAIRVVERAITRMTSNIDRIERVVGRIAADSRPRGRP
ncbi:hypothetical protein DPMN_134871 [Dreissena polymorpha]|uniref:Uncharacterized protein n=1 Tax=Dreissena polymorpha TaxID=45954 RepID=A0A9D4G0Q7_DREPO|nr:hypothetical protein DPMN_134871 [Dreissena polymorpha]